MTKTTLALIAAELNAAATRTLGQPVYRRLSGGLYLILVAHIDRRQLSLVRENAQPSRREENVIRAAFDVPGGALTVSVFSQVKGINFFITRLTWRYESKIEFQEIDGRMVATLVENTQE